MSVDTLATSQQFFDLDGDGYQQRTAWAGAGTGVLVLDADSDGKISRSSEFVFTEWAEGAESDLEALRRVFDTNHNNKLDAGDSRWSEFKIWQNGALVSLASQNIASIDLIATGSGQAFDDGSAITGTSTFTRTNGTTGMVGDAVLASEEDSRIVRTAVVTNADGTKTTTITGFDKDGSTAFRNVVTTSANGLSLRTQFDDDGDGIFDRSQTDVRSETSGVQRRIVSNFKADGSLKDSTTTTTSADLKTVTTEVDQDGDGKRDQSQIYQKNADGSTSTTVTQFSVSGAVLKRVMTTGSADGLTKTVSTDADGNGTYERVETEKTVVAADGGRTKTAEERSDSGALLHKTVTATSADALTTTTQHDDDGDGVFETRDVVSISRGANEATVNTVSTTAATGVLLARTVATTSRDGLVKTQTVDLDGDGAIDVVGSNTTVVTGGAMTQTVESRARNGSLLSTTTTSTSADRKTITIATDADGDGSADMRQAISVDAAGATSTTLDTYAAQGTNLSKTVQQTSADGLTSSLQSDLDGDGVFERTVHDVTTTGGDGSRTRTVSTLSASGALLERTASVTSADGLTRILREDRDGDGTSERTTVETTRLNSDGSRTELTTTTSSDGTLRSRFETYISADRKSTTTTGDLNGDSRIDTVSVSTIQSDGSRVETISKLARNGILYARSETAVSANGLVTTVKEDLNGDASYDSTTTTVIDLNANGSTTTTVSESPTAMPSRLLSRTTKTTSGNGLGIDSQVDEDADTGNGFETRTTEQTILNTDGSTTRTVSSLGGSGALIGKSVVTTTASKLISTTRTDLDGNGTFDRTLLDTSSVDAGGVRTRTVTINGGADNRIFRTQTITSADKRTASTVTDGNGDGTTDESNVESLNADGSTSVSKKTFIGGSLRSQVTSMTSASGLVHSSSIDLDGNGSTDRSTSDITTLNRDGSQAQSISEYLAGGALKNRTTIEVAANGLSKTTQWTTGTSVTRSMTETTSTAGNGDTVDTVTFKKATGSIESRLVTTTGNYGLTTTTTLDDDGDGVVDRTTVSTVNDNGSTTTTQQGRKISQSADIRSVTLAANGLSYEESYILRSASSGLQTKFYTTSTTSIDASGSTRQVVQRSESLRRIDGFSVDISANQQSVTRSWDFDGDGVYDGSQLDVTSLNSDGSETRTLDDYKAGSLLTRKVTATSANGLSTQTSWNFYGQNALAQRSSDMTTMNADGSKTRTIVNTKSDSSQLSSFTSTTSSDGTSVRISEDFDGTSGVDRNRDLQTTTLADGSTILTDKRYNASNVLLDSETTTVSADKSTRSISRDSDGDGLLDQTEVQERSVDGSSSILIKDYSPIGGASSSITAVFTSADGLLTTSYWDFDANNSVDQTRTSTKVNFGDGSQKISTRDTVGGNLIYSTDTFISGEGRYESTSSDVDGDGDVDRTQEQVRLVDGSIQFVTRNNADARNVNFLTAGGVYFRDEIAEQVSKTVSADGLLVTATSSYLVQNSPRTPYIYQDSTSQTQIDGSVVTNISEYYTGGSVFARGVLTLSADGAKTTLKKDANNDGTFEYTETAVKRIDGSIRNVVSNIDSSGNPQNIITEVSADGKSTSVLASIGSGASQGTATGIGVKFIADGATNDVITGSVGSDLIRSGAGRDTINGGAGDDLIDGGSDADTMIGGDGNDLYIVDNVGDVVQETSGKGSADTIQTSISLNIEGNDIENITLTGILNIDARGNAVSNIINGNAGNNALAGGAGNDTLVGDAGNDLLFGEDGNDVMNGGAGNDQLDGGAGVDQMGGGTGDDIYLVDDAGDTIVEYANEGIDTVNALVSFTLGYDIERLTLTGSAAINGNGNNLGNMLIGNAAANVLNGLGGDDEVHGGGGNDTLVGDAGNDLLFGEDGNDVMNGGAGNDQLDGGAGADQMGGGTGDDIYLVDDAGDTIVEYANEGIDTVNALVSFTLGYDIERLTLTGSAAINGNGNNLGNMLIGNAAANVLNGLGGDDEVHGGGGNDTLVGDAGNDLLFGEDGNDVMNGGAGNDQLDGGTGADQMAGSTGDDIYLVDDAGDTILEYANEGIDTVNALVSFTLGTDIERLTLTGYGAINGNGNNLGNMLIGNAAANVLNGLGGDDEVHGGGGNDTIVGDAGNDLLFGEDGNDVMNGGAGNDQLDGGAGVDQMGGGTGDDIYLVDDAGDTILEYANEGIDTVNALVSFTLGTDIERLTLTGYGAINGNGNNLGNMLIGNAAANVLNGLGGDDEVHGGGGNDTLVGDAGNDLLFGEDGNDVMNGGAGNDQLDGGAGVDQMGGGTGDDIYLVDDAGDTIVEYANEGIDTVNALVSFTLGTDIERLTLTGYGAINGNGNNLGNMLIGNAAANVLNGLGGDDEVHGGGGNDTLVGDAGNDLLFGEDGNDVMNGGAGNDQLDGGAGIDTLDYSDRTTAVAVTLNGATYATVTVGGVAEDTIRNFETIIGGSANDTFVGDSLDNMITGNAGNDSLDGGVGNDTLYGGVGNDILKGGTGADIFVFDSSLNGATNLDAILDFSAVDDRFWLDDAIFRTLAPGSLQAASFVIGTAATAAAAQIIYDKTGGKLFYDADGIGGAAQVQFASLGTNLSLTASSFQIV